MNPLKDFLGISMIVLSFAAVMGLLNATYVLLVEVYRSCRSWKRRR